MFNKTFIYRVTESSALFYGILLLNLILLFVPHFYPSGDGPAHLYNAQVLSQILKGNTAISEFYILNQLPIPNWTSHLMLLPLQGIIPAWLIEKLYLMVYISGMSLSFRYLIKALNPTNIALSILIFPFIHSSLFHYGFYNFSFSFILLFTTLGFWLRTYSVSSTSKYVWLLLLLTITYFTNILLFVFLGLTLVFFSIYVAYQKFEDNKNTSEAFILLRNQLIQLFLVALPGIVCAIVFYSQITFDDLTIKSYSETELLKWINDLRPLIVYDYKGEEVMTEHFFHVLIILLAVSFVKPDGNYAKINIIAIPMVILFVLYFVVPDSTSAGMMSDRFCLMAIMFALVWIVSRSVQSIVNGYLIIVVVGLHVGLLVKQLNGRIRGYDKSAQSINSAAQYISKNSIVLPVNLTENWMEDHFSNYLGVDKPMVILENYEAAVGWFPVKWNIHNFPNLLLGNKSSLSNLQWATNPLASKTKQIDYVFLFGKTAAINNSSWAELKEVLKQNYNLTYESEDQYIQLYAKK